MRDRVRVRVKRGEGCLGHAEEGLLREPLQPAELLSVVKRSGANWHLYWCLREPTLFGDASERPEGFAHTLRALAIRSLRGPTCARGRAPRAVGGQGALSRLRRRV